MNLNNLGAVVESALLAVQNDVDAIGATRAVKADMVETNLKLERANSSVTAILLFKTNQYQRGTIDGRSLTKQLNLDAPFREHLNQATEKNT